MLDQSTFLLEEHPANPSRSPESGLDWMTRAATSRLSSWRWLDAFAPAGFYGRTFLESCRMTAEQRWEPSSGSWGNSGIVDATGCSTLNLCEWPGGMTDSAEQFPSGGGVCSLSDILETTRVPSRYYLSPKACAGILRRAAKRGKALPPLLARALTAVADLAPTSIATED